MSCPLSLNPLGSGPSVRAGHAPPFMGIRNLPASSAARASPAQAAAAPSLRARL